MKTISIFISLLLSNFVGLSQTNPNYSTIIDSYKSKIEKIINSGNIKGMAIALIDGNRIVWKESFGYADYENKIKADSNTLFGIATGVNLFTGSAVMQLHEKKKFNVYDPVSIVCPDFKTKKRYHSSNEITIMDLLCHRSGLSSDLARNIYSKNSLSFDSIIELVQKEYAPYPPNYIYSYSNIGYSLLGVVIGSASGETYENYIKSNIFKPLGMNSSCFACNNYAKISKGYDGTNNLREDYNLRSGSEGLMIKSNINDMAKFTMSFLSEYKGPNILEKETVNRMYAKEIESSPLDFNKKYGVTWKYERINSAGQIYYHVSKSLNHRCLFALAPESNLAVVFLSNSVNSNALHEITMNLLDTCAILKGRDSYTNKVCKSILSSDTMKLNDEDLKKYEGYYANPKFVFEISLKQNKLYAEIDGNQYVFTPVKDGSFIAQIVLPNNKLHTIEKIKFQFVFNDKADVFIYHNLTNDQKIILGSKFHHQEISSLWKERTGHYELYETNKSNFSFIPIFELAYENGILVFNVIESSDNWNTALSIKDDNTAFTLGFGSHRGCSLSFVKENGKEILRYSGFSLIKVNKNK